MNWCPNIDLRWHGNIELEQTRNSRGNYFHCRICHWYSGIDKESEESAITQEIFIEVLKSILKSNIDVNQLLFRSKLAGEEPWYSLGERLNKYGKIRTTDLEMIFQGQVVTKFELKGWKNYDIKRFYSTGRAHINIDEVQDAAKSNGYICFVTLQDKRVVCTRAQDILNKWKEKSIEISKMVEEKVIRAIFSEFNKGALVVIAPDKQGNLRYVLSKEYKDRYCKSLEKFKEEILTKLR